MRSPRLGVPLDLLALVRASTLALLLLAASRADAQPPTIDGLDDLETLDAATLESLFHAGTIPADLPKGDAQGIVLFPGRGIANRLAGRLWKGKVFSHDPDVDQPVIVNKLGPDSRKALRATVRVGRLRDVRPILAREEADDLPSIVLDYSAFRPQPFDHVVDEMRLIVPGERIYLGRATFRDHFVCYFALDLPGCEPEAP